MSGPSPTLGRIVLYHPKPEDGIGVYPHAALVTWPDMGDGMIRLTVFLADPVEVDGRKYGTAFMPVMALPADEPTPGRWTWPPRTP